MLQIVSRKMKEYNQYRKILVCVRKVAYVIYYQHFFSQQDAHYFLPISIL